MSGGGEGTVVQACGNDVVQHDMFFLDLPAGVFSKNWNPSPLAPT